MEQVIEIDRKIGEQTSDDWVIQPRGFPAFLAERAPALSAFLSDSLYVEKAKRFDNADAQAVDYQKRFKTRARNISIAIFVSAVATALLTALPTLSDLLTNADASEATTSPSIIKYMYLVTGIVAAFASGVAIYNNQMIGQLKLYDQWMTSRAKAEIARLMYFKEAAAHLVAEKNDTPELLMLYCSFFKRFQLDLQQNYYTGRSKQHESSLRKTAKLGAIAAVIIAVSSGSSGLSGFGDSAFTALAALGTLGIALTALASRFESLNQDERNASRYKITAESLSKVAEKYSSVQKALAEGKQPAMLVQFVDAVHEQISLEHRQWTEDTADISTAFTELSATITNSEKTTN